MSLSQLSKSVRSSATLKLTAKFAVLKQQGEPVIHLGGGEPVSKAPAAAVKEAVDLISTGEVRYSPVSGVPDLKKAIIGYTENFYHRTVEPKNVMAASGAKHVIMVALQAILDPGDEVIFPVPYWVSYPDMV
ncbi:MAG: aminotransferase class I/II-fold pyridoxal phosphate-dependent enzyme, partial [Ignavibacteriales bacterium]|nr:aminotransferase class I/II-fold pyridoxal phosphate-dependent enzyme [Ignavibacteriales bacterium]